MAESLCDVCAISAARVIRRARAGIIAVPEDLARSGHIMVVSLTHAESLSGLPAAEADAFMALVGSATRTAEQSAAAHCYVVRIGDQSPHLHFHIVPRTIDDPPLAPFVFGKAGWGGGKNL